MAKFNIEDYEITNPMKPKRTLGHSLEMVNNIYGHLFPRRKNAILDKFNELSES